MKRQSTVAFSLIELMVILATIALLVALLMPVIGKARESARHAMCLNNLRQIAMLSANYVPMSGGWMPMCRTDPGRGMGMEPWPGQFEAVGLLPPGPDWHHPSTIARCESSPLRQNDYLQHANYAWNIYFGDQVYATAWNDPGWAVRVRVTRVRRPNQIMIVMDGSWREEQSIWPGKELVANVEHQWVEPRSYLYSFAPAGRVPYIHGERWNAAFVDGHVTSLAKSDPNFVDNPAWHPVGKYWTEKWESNSGPWF
jgi:prepilin-type processing-associated H-X9-DG protein